MRVLVVDDSQVSRNLIVMHLRKAGIDNVDEAVDGMDALMKLKNLAPAEKYDVVTLDIVMPKQDGLAIIKEIRQLAPETKIIMVSSQATARSVQIAIGFGIHGFVAKPFTGEKLLASIRNSLLG